jgi:CubicO group peptidase (beta-lactamase class C family)
MRLNDRLVTAAAIVGIVAVIPAHTFEPQAFESSVEDVGQILEPIRAEEQVPSLAAAVVRGGRLIAQGAVGLRRLGGTERVTLEDRYHLGSNTKAMTATLLGVLVDQGRLSWTSAVGDVLGKAVPAMDPTWRTVTLEQLLRHRSGAPAEPDPEAMAQLRGRLQETALTPMQRRLLVVEATIRRPPIFTPGTRFSYANLGYVIAGAMAETATGRAYDDLMRDIIFAPLGITSAGFGAPGTAERVDQPWGHLADATPVPPGIGADNPPFYDPSGRAHMTLRDWAMFASAHLLGDSRNAARRTLLLDPGTYDMLHRPVDEYAMGWYLHPQPYPSMTFEDKSGTPYGGTVLTHDGSNNRWRADVWLFPELNVAIVVATNQARAQVNHGGRVHDGPAHATGRAGNALFARYK